MALRRVSKTLPLLVLLAMAACPDPKGDIDQFVERTSSSRNAPQSSCTQAQGGALHDISGTSLFILHTGLTQENLYFEATVTNFVSTASGATFDASFQPLVTPVIPVPVGCTDHFTPTGSPIIVNGIQMDSSGNFAIDFGEQTVSACAGRLTQNIDATIKLTGTAAGPKRWCGCVNGTVKQPIPNATLSPGNGDLFAGIVMTPFPTAADLDHQFQPPPAGLGTLPSSTDCNCAVASPPEGCTP